VVARQAAEAEEGVRVKELYEAFAAARRDMKNLAFDSENSHFGNQYVSLPVILKAVNDNFRAHGLEVFQKVSTGVNGPVIETQVIHLPSGEAMTYCECEFPSSKKDSQGWGSAITYGRRYTLFLLAGIVGEPDDDGEKSSGGTVPEVKLPPASPAQPKAPVTGRKVKVI
jgi:hypothetical protein